VNKLGQKNFFLISFLPAIAYWYLEENYPVRVAISGGILLSILELSFEYYFTRHLHALSKFNFGLILFLGAVSLLGDEGIWFKLQPAISGVVIAAFLILKKYLGKSFFVEMLESMGKEQLPTPIVHTMETHISLMFGLYGLFMAYVAVYWSTDRWLFFKTIGFYSTFIVFMTIEVIYIRFKVKQMMKNQMKAEIFKNL
jgi:intracellular septation protein